MLYFKDPSISNEPYLQSLRNVSQTFSSPSRSQNRQSSIKSLSNLLSELVSIHREQFGEAQLRKDLRLLGNAIRIASQESQDISLTIKQVTWGINASALSFRSSGELSCLREVCKYIKRIRKVPTIFDIGANKGEWSAETIANTGTFSLHTFEPNISMTEELSQTIEKVMSNANQEAATHINMFGIGNSGCKTLFINHDSNEQASTVLNSGKPMYKNYEKIQVKMTKGSTYCKSKGIDEIDFIKIDTEGSELSALTTFDEYVAEAKIRFIQFEYGIASFYGNSSLNNFFNILKDRYSIHRILPEGITESLEYSEEIETFHWSNYIAIRKDNMDFLEHFNSKNLYA